MNTTRRAFFHVLASAAAVAVVPLRTVYATVRGRNSIVPPELMAREAFSLMLEGDRWTLYETAILAARQATATPINRI